MKKLLFFLAVLLAGVWAMAETGASGPYTAKELLALLKKIFSRREGEKSEIFIFIAEDGQYFIFDSEDPRSVSIDREEIERVLGAKGLDLSKVTNIIHNHPPLGRDFSGADLKAYEVLKAWGFTGAFQIFFPATGGLRTLKKGGTK